jgi:hypothetical protein
VSVSVTLCKQLYRRKQWLSCCKKKGEKIYFLTFGFAYRLANGEDRPQCFVCGEVLENDILNTRSRRWHFTRHTSLANRPLEFCERKLLEIRKHLNLMKTAVSTSTKALVASFGIPYVIAKNKKPHIIGGTLLLSAAISICEIMHGEKTTARHFKQFLCLIIRRCDEMNQCQKTSRKNC